MKEKPIAELVTRNNYKRFDPLYKCYCPKCNKVLKRNTDQPTMYAKKYVNHHMLKNNVKSKVGF